MIRNNGESVKWTVPFGPGKRLFDYKPQIFYKIYRFVFERSDGTKREAIFRPNGGLIIVQAEHPLTYTFL